jgi:hypothetical protein
MELKGARQNLQKKETRRRSGAFPFELAYRLISMFSVKGDIVVDPFLGTGTTLRAAAAAGRNSIGYEIEAGLRSDILSDLPGLIHYANGRIQARIDEHLAFVNQCRETGREMKYLNRNYQFPVVTRQETELLLDILKDVSPIERDGFQVIYSDDPGPILLPPCSISTNRHPETNGQLSLF